MLFLCEDRVIGVSFILNVWRMRSDWATVVRLAISCSASVGRNLLMVELELMVLVARKDGRHVKRIYNPQTVLECV